MIQPTDGEQYSRRRMARQRRIGAQIGGRFDALSTVASVDESFDNIPTGPETTDDKSVAIHMNDILFKSSASNERILAHQMNNDNDTLIQGGAPVSHRIPVVDDTSSLYAMVDTSMKDTADDTPIPCDIPAIEIADGARNAEPPDRASVPSLSRRRERLENTYAKWEDTSTQLPVPEQKAFWGKQPPLFWITAVVLLVSLCAVIAVVGVNRWHEADLARKEARRIQALADEKAKYKFLYRDIIEQYADQNNIDPALVAAVIYHESRFEPKAESSVGARGLMQIMEETGPWIAEKLGETGNYTFDSLFVPETNIRFGVWYLGYLSSRFGGDIVKIAAGYHAGQGTVSDWLKNEAYSHDGWSLDVIPYQETDQYVKRVVNAYEIYTKHYYAPEETGTAAAS